MSKRINLTLLIVMLLFTKAGLPVSGQRASKSDSGAAKKTLHDLAKEKGCKLVVTYNAGHATTYPNVEELAKRSDLIVVGRVLSHKTSLTPDGRFITQDFLVKVQEIIKGNLAKRQAVLISTPGGTHRFADGTYVAVMSKGYRQLADKGLYVYFLKARPKNSVYKGYRLVSDSQGAFALKNDKVDPADANNTDPVSTKYRGMQASEFLRNIHKAVPRKQK
jgi:hypothetical protein